MFIKLHSSFAVTFGTFWKKFDKTSFKNSEKSNDFFHKNLKDFFIKILTRLGKFVEKFWREYEKLSEQETSKIVENFK